jgi:hypothetical protein
MIQKTENLMTKFYFIFKKEIPKKNGGALLDQ